MRFLLSLICGLMLFSCGTSKRLTECTSKAPSKKTIKKVPDEIPTDADILTVPIVYYVLDEVKDTALIESEILTTHEHLNTLYGTAFNFVRHPFVIYSRLDMTIDEASNRKELLRAELENIREIDEALSVYIVGDSNQGLLGFTVVFPNPEAKKYYVQLAPKYDNLIVSRAGLANINTVPHEVGHVGGLIHPHDIKKNSIFELFGMFTKRDRCVNIMSYSCCAGEVTPEQIGFMWNYFALYRYNLILLGQDNFKNEQDAEKYP